MGLDIRVRTTVKQVLDSGDFDDQPELERLFTKACENLGLKPQDAIHTRPGSYSGIHQVRMAYAELNGVKTNGHPTAWAMDLPLPKSHLCCHSDCEGWYLPEEFDDPIFEEGKPHVGSSPKLLAELRSMDPTKLDDYTRHAWDALLVPAVASVFCHEPIKFT